MDNLFHKKFSVGLSLQMNAQQYYDLFKVYGSYIDSIYFSPPLGERYHSRLKVAKEFERAGMLTEFYDIIQVIRGNGIHLDAVLNTYHLNDEDIRQFLSFCEAYDIDDITTLEEYAGKIDKHPKRNLIYSYNNGLHDLKGNLKTFSCFDTIVLGTDFLRCPKDINMLSKTKQVKILLNNGCSPNCLTCRYGSQMCKNTLDHNLSTKSYDRIYAEQSFFPWELTTLVSQLENWDMISLKISNRTSGYRYIVDCLHSYIYGDNVSPYIKEQVGNFHLWFRLGEFSKYYKRLDLDNIEKIKRTLKWE